MEFNVLDFGAAGNGTADDTAAIQAAIDACRRSGGGKVVLPGGKVYRSGVLELCSDLEFHLEMGAILKGSDRLEDYVRRGSHADHPAQRALPSYENSEYNGAPTYYFLYAKDCENLAITGFGRIDGNEERFYGEVTRWHIEGSFYPRVPMLFLENVSHLTITGVTLARSAFWTVHLVGCRDVRIDGIRILNNLRMANCDGIDPDHCRDVRITNCHIECADDCIVLKNTAAAMNYGPCENIVISNCTLTSTSAAIKFGSESEALFRNVLVENCVISRSNRGISLQLRDPGSIENVIFRGLTIQTRLFHREMFWGQAEPIAITVLSRHEHTPVGTVKNITFRDIHCQGENGILLYGQKPGDLQGIRFDNVSLTLTRATDYPTGHHDLRPAFDSAPPAQGLHYLLAHNAGEISLHSFRGECDEAMGQLVSRPFALSGCSSLSE